MEGYVFALIILGILIILRMLTMKKDGETEVGKFFRKCCRRGETRA